ncbi:MAG: sugar ABC transporter permease [Chloroflexi bacterium]|nr:sugar ABC transporter permease [Chloroflexota bacterium]MBM3153380.1 sugar ABC transporter permease [Chloroflexota bacterium]
MSTVSRTDPAPASPRSGISAHTRRQWTYGFLFLLPWFIGFFAFQLLPILFTLFLSFTDYTGAAEFKLGNFNFVGLQNYRSLFVELDALPSMGVTLKFALIGIPLGLVVPLMLAVIVNSRRLIFSNLFRTLFYLPSVIPVVAGAIIFNGVMNAQSGWLNLVLKAIGIAEPPRWFSDPVWAGFALNLLAIWGVGNAMVILLAGLQSVPTELYEAATVDGAGPITKFFYITVPMISPVIFYNVTIGVILAFQYFVPALLIGSYNGNPQGALLFFPTVFYREGFVYSRMGYASVLAMVIFLVTMIVTGLLFFFGQKLVYYASGETS